MKPIQPVRIAVLRHAINHLHEHNSYITKMIIRDMTLDSKSMAYMADVFQRKCKEFKKDSPAGRPRLRQDAKLWFMRWNLLDTARVLRAAANGREEGFPSGDEVLTNHDKWIGKIRASAEQRGMFVFPPLESVDHAEELLRLRYPGLLDAHMMADVHCEALCAIEAEENTAPAGPLSTAAMLKISGALKQSLEMIMPNPLSPTFDPNLPPS